MNKKIISAAVVIAFILANILGVSAAATSSPALLKVHYIDVGQADSILIQLPNSQVALIDAGNNADADTVVNYIKKLGIKKIDYLIGTHPHEDHIGSMDTVIENFSIGAIYLPEISTNTDTFLDLLTAIKNKGLKVTEPKANTNIIETKDLKLKILAPTASRYDNLNDYSIVTKLTYKNNSFMFMGDVEKTSESQILKQGYKLKSDVLKVSHHGGRNSTTEEFLDRVLPKYAVISVGKDNDYGHPTRDVLDRLEEYDVEVYRTDLSGTIIATSDGDKITFDKKASPTKEKGLSQNYFFRQPLFTYHH